MSKSTRQLLSVTELNRAAKDILESYLPLLWVEGELSNWSVPSSGHWYFTLKDANAQVRCAMFKNRNNDVRFRPAAGQKVVIRGKVSLYEGRGDYQLIAEHMEPAGFGDLQRQFEALKNKLQTLGWFDAQHKQPLPTWPKHLGLITSATGAAVHDILHVLKRRFPALPVTILPVPVQGVEAAPQIVKAINLANELQFCDVIILGRGGGSIEDLWAFNDEGVARAIFESHIPIISAVGHEVDFTIADFVADVRAPTPSAAAELVSPNQTEITQLLRQYEQTFIHHWQQHLRWSKQKLDHLRARLQHPGHKLAAQMQAFDQLEMRLMSAMTRKVQLSGDALHRHQQRLQQVQPSKLLTQYRQLLQRQIQRLTISGKANFARHQQRFSRLTDLLNSVSPLNTLGRGYAIVQNQNGAVVTTSADVKVGQSIQARLKHGIIHSQVTATDAE